MIKKIFIGSSIEAKQHAKQIGRILEAEPGVSPVYWWDYFNIGELTFVGIESLSSDIAGAVIVASPDVVSNLRGEAVKTPNANVLFEFGYLSSSIGRKKVALCRYDDTHLPSDFAGLTHVPMGPFTSSIRVAAPASEKLIKWVRLLSCPTHGFPVSKTVHGLSGSWKYENVLTRWRGHDITSVKDFVVLKGNFLLDISADGSSGTGIMTGELQVHLDGCEAEFSVCNKVTEIKVKSDGSLAMRSETFSRQLIREIRGIRPQSDGFTQELTSAREFEYFLQPSHDDEKTLVGTYRCRHNGKDYSLSNIKMWRS